MRCGGSAAALSQVRKSGSGAPIHFWMVRPEPALECALRYHDPDNQTSTLWPQSGQKPRPWLTFTRSDGKTKSLPGHRRRSSITTFLICSVISVFPFLCYEFSAVAALAAAAATLQLAQLSSFFGLLSTLSH